MLTTNSSLMDGINRHILNVSVALNSYADIDVAVCTVHKEGDLNAALRLKGIKEFSLGFPNGHTLGVYKSFDKVVKHFCPDIIHLHVVALMERIYLSVHRGGYKLIKTVHGIATRNTFVFRNLVDMCLLKIFPLNIDGCCYISNGVKEYYQKSLTSIKISRVCYNPIVFPKTVQPSMHKLHKIIGIPADNIIIGTVCRVAAVKNPTVFTSVMCEVLTQVANSHAVIIGDGDEALVEDCKLIVRKYGLENRFHWLGYRLDAAELVRDFNCFIMTSISEGMPTSVLECFVSKTPIAILEGDGGINDILRLNNKEHPIVVTASKDNLNDFSTKIIQLLLNRIEAEIIAENAYNVSKMIFGMEHVIERLKDMYYEMLKDE